MDKEKSKKKAKRLLRWGIIAFVIVFLLHWGYSIYGYVTYINTDREAYTYTEARYNTTFMNNAAIYPNGGVQASSSDIFSSSLSRGTNIASGQMFQRVTTPTGSVKNVMVDQKYEKTASMTAETTEFEKDQTTMKDIIKKYNAVIQQENRTGLKDAQQIYLVIGVMPDNFDDLVEDIRKIGEAKSYNVQQIDKTQQYLELVAERETLEQMKASYSEIKELAEKVEEKLKMEDRILEVDRQIRDINVNLGTYSNEYSFCTVMVELREVVEIEVSNEVSLSVPHILSLGVDSLVFTLQLFGIILLIICCILVGLTVVVFTGDYISRWFGRRYNKQEAIAGDSEEVKQEIKTEAGEQKEEMKKDVEKKG